MRTFSIILADDEQNILYGMQKGINWEELGFIVAGTAQNGKEVLEMMDDLHPDLVISDIKMPFMDGLELAKTIHENYMNTKVILSVVQDHFGEAMNAIAMKATLIYSHSSSPAKVREYSAPMSVFTREMLIFPSGSILFLKPGVLIYIFAVLLVMRCKRCCP